MNTNNLFAIPFLLSILTVHANQFNADWSEMQHIYNSLCKGLKLYAHSPISSSLYHPQWQKFSTQITQLILGNPNPHFLKFPALSATMVRHGMHIGQSFEICYLTKCISTKTKKLLATFKEPSFCNLTNECPEFNCSANALGQLYYATRILEQTSGANIHAIVEFGGGYGCLTHILKTFIPQANMYIIDIPELLAVQYLYLKKALPHETIHIHTPDHLETLSNKGIHLIPTHLIPELNLQADLFVSTFALSEVTSYIQQLVASTSFFNAHTCYITGQLDGWGSFGFEHHDALHENIRSCYQLAICQPFHLFLDSIKSYEIIATHPHNQNKECNNSVI